MRTKAIVWASAMALCTFAACKKDKEPVVTPPKVNCDLLMETSSETSTSTYEYDAQERIVKVSSNNNGYTSTQTIAYKDNGLTVVETGPDLITTYTLDANKRPVRVENSYNTGSRMVLEYGYDATGNVVKAKEMRYESPDDNIPEEQSISMAHTIANGNVVKTVVTDDNTGEILSVGNITHDLTRVDNMPNPRPYTSILGNGYGGVSKNLPVSLSVVQDNLTIQGRYTYEFDSKGRVSTRTTTGKYGDDEEFKSVNNYKYKCD